MKFKSYTLMLVPSDSASIKKLRIPAHMIHSIFLIATIIMIFLGYVLYDYATKVGRLQSINELKIRNRKLEQQLYSYKIKIDGIESTLERINNLTTRLKIISNLQDPERHEGINLPYDESVIEDEIDELDLKSETDIDNQFRDMQLKLREINYKISFQEEELTKFSEYLEDQSSLLAATPAIAPVRGGWVTSRFGYRRDPFTGMVKHHDGLDISSRLGTTIVAPADGVVTFAGTKPGYGKVIVIDHGYGISTRYGHNSRFYVSHGDIVKRGMPIAAVGNTGRSTGPHSHYEVRINGLSVDPEKFILDEPW
jgi:murein DD-endopeptidase MepM/ murein hydrolase activator NlpD